MATITIKSLITFWSKRFFFIEHLFVNYLVSVSLESFFFWFVKSFFLLLFKAFWPPQSADTFFTQMAVTLPMEILISFAIKWYEWYDDLLRQYFQLFLIICSVTDLGRPVRRSSLMEVLPRLNSTHQRATVEYGRPLMLLPSLNLPVP